MIHAALLTIPESSASTVFGMFDLFKSAGRDWGMVTSGVPGTSLIEPCTVGRGNGPLQIANGVQVSVQHRYADCPRPDVVCVPELFVSLDQPLRGRYAEEVAWLRRCHDDGAILATSCSGALLLAEAGLLDGEDATTHWAFCEVMQRDYPAVRVHPRRAMVTSGEGQRLVMAGGGSSWLDLSLYLIARLAGVEAAMQTAKVNLIDWHDVGQQPFACLARSRQSEDAVIARCQEWLAGNYRQSAPVAAMAALSGLPERSFKRRFQQATGMAPLAYVHTLRLEEAKQLLEATTLAVEAIANEVGYEDAGFFSRLFRREVGLTPAQYRKRFGSLRRALQA
ncbi:MAG: helix-turn-helix domain-containing protein [Moraxellaceae bacterium]|nr:helix-turn-helix domain-containing protein [Moraxellaceae bacterium]